MTHCRAIMAKGTADDPCSNLGERHIERSCPSARVTSDFERLFCTLVADNAVPAGYLSVFLKLEGPARRATLRDRQRYTACQLLSESAPYERDCLLPTPTRNYTWCTQTSCSTTQHSQSSHGWSHKFRIATNAHPEWRRGTSIRRTADEILCPAPPLY